LVGQFEVYKDVGARQESVGWVIDIDFDEQRTRCNVDRVGIANETAMEGLARKFIEGLGRWRAGTSSTGVHLGDRDV